MKRRILSKFPLHKPFEVQKPTTPLSEVALRLVVNFFSDAPYVVGTATIIAGNLAVTAKHVFNDILDSKYLAVPLEVNQSPVMLETHLAVVQVIILGMEPEYIIWDVFSATLDPSSDIALLHLATNPHRSHPRNAHEWRTPEVMSFPPKIGDSIAAFGYRLSSVVVSKNAEGGNHIDLNDEPIVSVGVVREIYEWKRDNVMLPFPCYRVEARFDGGMSGGPVFDETGALCGIVCANIAGSHLDGEPVSYVTTLWPLFRLMVEANRGGSYPRDVKYPAIELARDRQIRVEDLPRLERWFAEHIA